MDSVKNESDESEKEDTDLRQILPFLQKGPAESDRGAMRSTVRHNGNGEGTSREEGCSDELSPKRAPLVDERNMDDKANTVFVGHIPPHFDDDRLSRLFVSIGPIISSRILRDRKTDQSRGCGFVQFASEQSAKKALAMRAIIDPLTKCRLNINPYIPELGMKRRVVERESRKRDINQRRGRRTMSRSPIRRPHSSASFEVVNERADSPIQLPKNIRAEVGPSKEGEPPLPLKPSTSASTSVIVQKHPPMASDCEDDASVVARNNHLDEIEDRTFAENKSIFVGRFSTELNEQHIRHHFERHNCGAICHIETFRNAFRVEFVRKRSAAIAIREMNGREWGHGIFVCEWWERPGATPKRRRGREQRRNISPIRRRRLSSEEDDRPKHYKKEHGTRKKEKQSKENKQIYLPKTNRFISAGPPRLDEYISASESDFDEEDGDHQMASSFAESELAKMESQFEALKTLPIAERMAALLAMFENTAMANKRQPPDELESSDENDDGDQQNATVHD